MKTAIIISDSSTNHLTGIGHPEQPDRVTYIINKLKQNKNLVWEKIRMRIIKTKISSGINIEAAVGAAKIPFLFGN